jgi:hypothetical protein
MKIAIMCYETIMMKNANRKISYSTLFSVMALRLRTQRCGFLSPLSTSFSWPSSPND